MNTDQAMWRNGSETISGFNQFYRDWEPPEPSHPPMLALHGSLTQSGSWIALAETARTIRMLCPDQRGFGRSADAAGDSCAEFAADALALSERLLPARFAVMGHSFACSIALEVARLAPGRVAAAVLVDPVVPIGKPSGSSVAAITYPERFASYDDAERHFRETEEGAWPGEPLRRFVRDVTLGENEGGPWRLPYTRERLARLRAFTASAESDYDLFAKAKSVRCPVLVFRGAASRRFPREAEEPFLDAFPSRPELVVCPTSGHFPANTETGLVASALRRFVAGL